MSEEPFKIVCPKCGYTWPLKPKDLRILSCESAGVYGIYITCPVCAFTQDLDK